ncbi:MAG: serpin family protein [bacterium]
MAIRRNPGLLGTAAALVLLTACSRDPGVSSPSELPRELTASEQQIADAGGAFGLKLFRAVSASEGNKNVFLGPLSVSMALGMTLNGAEGATYEAMQHTLELAGLTEEEINTSYQSLIELLTTVDPQVILEIANSIWYRQDFPVAADFVERNEEYFDAVVQGLDFGSPTAVETINDWVARNTREKIPEILDQISPLEVMFLVNAIYFKGTWQYPFDPDKTADRPFTRADGSVVQVPSMQLEGEFPLYSDDYVTAVDLPYGGGLFSMTLLAPGPSGGTLDSLIAGLDGPRWAQITEGLRPQELGLVQMPRFECEYKILLNEVLKALGMEIAFGADADFDRMVEGGDAGLAISRVLHSTFVKVNEEGTEAAAATVVSIDRSVPPSVVLDEPFVFVIRERTSGTILFIGKMMDPLPG